MRSKQNDTNNSWWRMGKKLHLQKNVVWKSKVEKQHSRQEWWSFALFTTFAISELQRNWNMNTGNKHLGFRTQICLIITTSTKTLCQLHADQNQKIAVKLTFRENSNAVVQSIQWTVSLPVFLTSSFIFHKLTMFFPRLSSIDQLVSFHSKQQ